MRHRDSMGVKQVRPAPPRPSIILPVVESILTRSRTHIIQSHTRTTAQPTQVYGDGAAQFLSAGRGVLHEEMWELQGGPSYQDIELFQLWINLPRGQKGMQPSIQTAGACATSGGGEAQSKGPIPTVTVPSSFPSPSSSTTTVRVVMGEAEGVKSPIQPWTPVTVLHVTCAPGARWTFPLPASHSLTLYVRRGPLDVVVGEGTAARIATYETGFFQVNRSGNGKGMSVHCRMAGLFVFASSWS